MPHHVQFYRKSDTEWKGNVEFLDIDIEMCKHFNQPCDSDKWLCGWVDSIGMYLAIGRTLEQVKIHLQESGSKYQGLIKITEYLNENFSTNSHWVPK